MLEIAEEVELDLNTKDEDDKTGFIRACEEKHPEVVDLLFAKAEDLNIDLQAKDDSGRSGFDHISENRLNLIQLGLPGAEKLQNLMEYLSKIVAKLPHQI